MKANFTTTTGKTFTAFWNGKLYGAAQTAYVNISESGNPRGKVTFQTAGDRRVEWTTTWLQCEDGHAAIAALRLQGFDPIAEEPIVVEEAPIVEADPASGDPWGLLQIECDEFPQRLIQSGPYRNAGLVTEEGKRGFWLNCWEQPGAAEIAALEEAKIFGWIENYSIRPYTTEELARRWT